MTKLHIETAEKRGKAAANQAIVITSAIINFGIRESHYIGLNPCSLMKKFRGAKRYRFLTREELHLFLDALEGEGKLFNDYFRILLFTGARKSSVLAMKWKDIDLDLAQWRLIEDESKNDDINVIYLPKPAIDILTTRFSENSKASKPSKYVFPGNGVKGHLVDPKRSFNRVRNRMKVHNIIIHDLRRTLGSYMAITGSGLPIIGKALNHKTPEATQIYARLSNDPVEKAVNTAADTMEESWVIHKFKSNTGFLQVRKKSHYTFLELLR